MKGQGRTGSLVQAPDQQPSYITLLTLINRDPGQPGVAAGLVGEVDWAMAFTGLPVSQIVYDYTSSLDLSRLQ